MVLLRCAGEETQIDDYWTQDYQRYSRQIMDFKPDPICDMEPGPVCHIELAHTYLVKSETMSLAQSYTLNK